MSDKFQIEENSPIMTRAARDEAARFSYGFVVVSFPYGYGAWNCSLAFGGHSENDKPASSWRHKTLAAAVRRLASVTSGKLLKSGTSLCVVVTPEGRVMTLEEARVMTLGEARAAVKRDKIDARYSVRQEFYGGHRQGWVVRFCGDWIGRMETKEGAIALARSYEIDRQAKIVS